MEESGVFEYWFAFLFALGFCVWFPTYVVKTKGPQGISTWGLALCLVRFVLRTAAAFDQFDPRYHPFFVAELYKREL